MPTLHHSAQSSLHLPRVDVAEQPQPSRLLALPPELRNRIYDYVLTENEAKVVVTPALKPPPLLLACTQIRSEALALWYSNNDFQIGVHNCDGTLHIKWGLHYRLLRRTYNSLKAGQSIQWNFTGGANWKNLMAWLRESHREGLLVRLLCAEWYPGYVRLVVGAHAMRWINRAGRGRRSRG